jgi:hypothetical protein
MSEPTPPSPDEAKRREASAQPAGRREILGGFAFGLGVPLMIAAAITLTPAGGRTARWENLGVWMFFLAFPDALIAAILAIIPRTRRRGLGMLLGSGILLLLSLLTCGIR